jgi:4-aminobutyrate aminotransferase-like enzyme
MFGRYPAPDAYRISEANVADRFAADVQEAIDDLARHGISASGPLGHVLKIRPPLPFSRGDGEEFLERFQRALASV